MRAMTDWTIQESVQQLAKRDQSGRSMRKQPINKASLREFTHHGTM